MYNPIWGRFANHTCDYSISNPKWRQGQVDSLLFMEKDVIEKREEQGSMKVLKGNPRKNW